MLWSLHYSNPKPIKLIEDLNNDKILEFLKFCKRKTSTSISLHIIKTNKPKMAGFSKFKLPYALK